MDDPKAHVDRPWRPSGELPSALDYEVALDAEDAAYRHMRDVVPDLSRPARERGPVTDSQRRAIDTYEKARARRLLCSLRPQECDLALRRLTRGPVGDAGPP